MVLESLVSTGTRRDRHDGDLSPQYAWRSLPGPLNQKLGTTLPQLQWTFSLLIILQTWLSPFQVYLVDRFGPRLLIACTVRSSICCF